MVRIQKIWGSTLVAAALLVAPVHAQSVDEINSIIRQLAPIGGQTVATPPASSLTAQAPTSETDSAQPPVVLEITVEDRVLFIDTTYAMDFQVFFALDSAELNATGRADLAALGAALESRELRRFSYLIAGHTDASGDAGYNMRLSQRRALAARRFLVENFAIEPSRLIAVGLGETRLSAPDEPLSGVNRRVEVAMIVPEN